MEKTESNNGTESQQHSFIDNQNGEPEGYLDEDGNFILLEGGEGEMDEEQEGYEQNEEEGEYEEGEMDEENELEVDEGDYDNNLADSSHKNSVARDGSQENSRMTEQRSQLADGYEHLAPERKVRFKLFRFINQLRDSYMLTEFYQDLLGNKVAMEYAKLLIEDKENENIIELATKLYFPGEFKVSHFVAFVDINNDDGGKKNKYIDYTPEFEDAHSTLVEFEKDRENLLSEKYNTVSIGMAFDEEKVAIVDIFTIRDLTIESCSINEEMGSIIVKGHMINDNFGVYAMRIVSEDNLTKTLLLINPSTINSPEQKNRPFIASFSNAQTLLQDKTPKLIEVYIRERPNTIRYSMTFTENMAKFEQDLKFLKIDCRMPLESFPSDVILREQRREEEEEKKRVQEEEMRRIDERNMEREEKDYRIRKIDSEGLGL